MNANELRLGNYVTNLTDGDVRIPTGITQMIGNIGFFGVDLYDYKRPFAVQVVPTGTSIYDLSPIPLTEEWLLRLGFVDKELDEWNYYIERSGEIVFSIAGLDILYKGEIKFVHSLQNLYFALTNEELTIKKQKP